MKKKIGILTQPLKDNYGGLLQAYALKTILEQIEDTDVYIINRLVNENRFAKKNASKIKNNIIRIISKVNSKIGNRVVLPNKSEISRISEFTTRFKNNYIIDITRPINSDSQMKEVFNYNFDAIVVGSDQVWRPRYSPNIYNYFLDFISEKKDIKRVAYAASFGVDNWEYDKEQEEKCRQLIKEFDAISVREESGVKLCNDYLGVNAELVLDPTILLTPFDYQKLIYAENEPPSAGDFMTYILDTNDKKSEFISNIENITGLKHFTVMREKTTTLNNLKNIENCIYPSPIKWLKGFSDAKFVVTDSFHGTIFSILYNVPFLVIGNKSRGLARFESILSLFGLTERLIYDYNNFNQNLIQKEIDWNSINEILKNERKKSVDFLLNGLNF